MKVLTFESAEIQSLLICLESLEKRMAEFVREVCRPDFYSLVAFEKMFFIGRETLHDYKRLGRISIVYIKGKRYISREDVEGLIEANYFPACDGPERLAEEVDWRGEALAMSPEAILAQLERVEKLFEGLVCGIEKLP